MRQMRLTEYIHDIEEMDSRTLIGQFRKLEQNREAVKRTIRRGVEEARAALDEQYDLLFASPRGRFGRVPPGRDLGRHLESRFLHLNESIWRRLPVRLRDLSSIRAYGAWLHTLVCRSADREMYLGTSFLRNRPALELMRRVAEKADRSARLRIAVLGCSIGVEVYSILWTLRSHWPDLELVLEAVDISPDAVRVAERGVYGPEASQMVGWPIFDGVTEAEREEMFDWDGDDGHVKSWLREGVTWRVGDASDPNLIPTLGPQHLVVANNFLCHLEPARARQCLQNLAGLVSPGGYLIVTGVDLDVRTQVALDLGWEPIPDLRAEIHEGDSVVRSDWPWRWWGLEPLDRRRRDWETRYSAVFRNTVPGRSLFSSETPQVRAVGHR
jgi:chemotaxis methyl-accepting protein methylase